MLFYHNPYHPVGKMTWRWLWPGWDDRSECANFQMGKKVVYWLRAIVVCERRRRGDTTSAAWTRLRRLLQRGMTKLCSPLVVLLYTLPLICPAFKAHTRGTTRILPDPLSYPISWQLKYFIYLLYQMHLLEIVGKLIELRYHIWK